MSIFPKRTVAGSSVTIHWNLVVNSPICPYVRIGIIDPGEQTHMLFDDHVLALPATTAPYTPLLLLACCLAGKQSREKLIGILNNLHNGRHYYFTWPVPQNASPGKYTLLSEMYINGTMKVSETATEDFFYVEQLEISAADNGQVTIHNPGPEPVPVKIMNEVFSLPAAGSHTVSVHDKNVFLVYNEERITIPLHTGQARRPLRNQQYLFITKQETCYVLPREGNDAYCLTGTQRAIWEAADGMNAVDTIRQIDSAGYDEMIAHGLIKEI